MDIKIIQSFISDTIYDFQTIEFLTEYGRIKETIPILLQILERIQLFRGRIKDEQGDIKNVFLESFWDKDFSEKTKVGDVLIKIKEMVKGNGPILDKDLQGIGYLRFIEQVHVWTLDNIYLLRQLIKSSPRKKIESAVKFLSILVAGVCIVSIILMNVFIQDWGLKGDFYEGQNFDKHISTGRNMTIDFRNYLEMNPILPQGHFSARWQGFLISPKDGEYTFFVKVNDGVRLMIDGQVLINEWHDNHSAEFQKKIFLSKGEHWLCLEHYNNSSDTILKLYWQFESDKKGVIPAWYLRSQGELFNDLKARIPQILIFTPKDVESGSGWIQKLPNNHAYWPNKDHLLANNPKGLVSVVKHFTIPQRGRYLVNIFHDSAVDFVDATIKISCINHIEEPMQTWSPSPIYGQDSYICEFKAGKNSVHIFGKGNPKRRFLGVNSIVLNAF